MRERQRRAGVKLSHYQRCRVPGCHASTRIVLGLCVRHYNRRRRYGDCAAATGCAEPATSHIGLCDAHTPAGILP